MGRTSQPSIDLASEGRSKPYKAPSHKQHKLKFLAGEEAQRSQYGVTDAFVREGKLRLIYGFIQKEHRDYNDFSYAVIRGWSRNS